RSRRLDLEPTPGWPITSPPGPSRPLLTCPGRSADISLGRPARRGPIHPQPHARLDLYPDPERREEPSGVSGLGGVGRRRGGARLVLDGPDRGDLQGARMPVRAAPLRRARRPPDLGDDQYPLEAPLDLLPRRRRADDPGAAR